MGIGALFWLSLASCRGEDPPNLTECSLLPAGGPQAWPEADQLFRHDPRWLGGDGAYSVGLSDGRVVWFFDDSYVSPGCPRDRRHATFVHNSVGVQSQPDPTQSTIQFYWQTFADGSPHSFFPDPPGSFYGVGVPVMVKGNLLVFLRREHQWGNFGVIDGWDAALISNPEAPPDAWDLRMLNPSQTHPGSNLVWSIGGAGVLVMDGYLYAHVTDAGSLDAYLARYSLDAAAAGDFSAPEWWCGAAGWIASADNPSPALVLANAGTEFSVHRAATGQFVMASLVGSILDAPHSNLALRTAPSISGPWSDAIPVYHPPEGDENGVFVYAGKAHPELGDQPIVLTYGQNGWNLQTTIDDMCLYFPRFVRASLDP